MDGPNPSGPKSDIAGCGRSIFVIIHSGSPIYTLGSLKRIGRKYADTIRTNDMINGICSLRIL